MLRAEVRPPRTGAGPAGRRGAPPAAAMLEVRPDPRLRSHYPDHGQWVTAEHQKFLEGFNRRAAERHTGGGAPSWRAEAAEVLLPLAGNRVLTPDFTFFPGTPEGTMPPGGAPEPVHMEVLAHPDAERAARLLAAAQQAGHDNYLLACRGTPALRAALEGHPRLLLFRRALLPGPVLERLENRAGET